MRCLLQTRLHLSRRTLRAQERRVVTTHPDLNEYGLFIQDDWRVTPKFTLNLGLRYDLQDLADPAVNNPSAALAARGLNTTTPIRDGNNFAPRFGFSYAFDDKTVVRGGYGIFFGRTPAIMLGTAHSQNGIQVTGVSLNCTLVPNPCPTYPNIFAAPPRLGGVNPSLYLFTKDYAQPYIQQGRLGVERELFANTSLSVSYLYFRGVHISRTRDINLGAASADDGYRSCGSNIYCLASSGGAADSGFCEN